MNFVVKNKEHFQTISALHNVNTRNRDHLHRQTANCHIFKKVHIMLRSLINKQVQFKVALKRYLNTPPFYSVEELLALKNDSSYMHKFFPLLFCCMDFASYVHLMLNFFVLHLEYFEKVFVCGFIIFCLCCFCSFCIYLYVMYLYDLFHILLLPLQT